MSNLSTLSLNALLNRAVASLNKERKLTPLAPLTAYNGQEKHSIDAASSQYRAIAEKLLSFLPVANYQKHTLHYVLKALGYFPNPLLEGIVSRLKGPTTEQYPYADAHMRLIIAVNARLKTPLQLDKMQELRSRFAADAIAMQDPKVWQQANTSKLSSLKIIGKNTQAAVSWCDKTIANADDTDMRVRCYQAGVISTDSIAKKSKRESNYQSSEHNPDQTVMLFFHGGGFCIGDVDTHHELCHTICAQTGWAVVSVDYRLAPEHAAPTALRDAIAAYDWVASNSYDLGALSSRIVLAGDSAGGGLSTLVAQQIAKPTSDAWLELGSDGQKTLRTLKTLPKPLAQMPLYPVTDIETDYPSWALYGEGLLLDHADVAVFDAAFMQDSPLPRQHVLISPMIGDNSAVCPTYVIASELDVLRDEAFVYAEQLQLHGIAVETHTVLGAPHGFIHLMSVHKDLEQQTHFIIDDFARFVREIISIRQLQAA